MTREEAANRIRQWLCNGKRKNGRLGHLKGWFSEDDKTAFEMAIKALKHEQRQEGE